MDKPLVSICIPAYKKPQYVVRCLDSILKQDYKNIEVIISDDSPDEDIKQAIQRYTTSLNIHYFQNNPSLKTPKNWNAAINKGSGDYILLLHQDDWFHAPDAISTYSNALQDKEVDFVFCRNTAISEGGEEMILQAIPRLLSEMSDKPNQLVLAQVIGPPSNTMFKRTVKTRYDERFIWLVDVDYYSRMLKEKYRYIYIDRHLVSIGLHADQATVFCRENPEIIVRENILFASKIGESAFNDVLIFDYFWRFLRNYKIRSLENLLHTGLKKEEIPRIITKMIGMQQKIPLAGLQFGPLSKMLMFSKFLHFKMNRNS